MNQKLRIYIISIPIKAPIMSESTNNMTDTEAFSIHTIMNTITWLFWIYLFTNICESIVRDLYKMYTKDNKNVKKRMQSIAPIVLIVVAKGILGLGVIRRDRSKHDGQMLQTTLIVDIYYFVLVFLCILVVGSCLFFLFVMRWFADLG